ncbi:hypothetical protein ABPG75_000597 [Micractinium tetrahymenae]
MRRSILAAAARLQEAASAQKGFTQLLNSAAAVAAAGSEAAATSAAARVPLLVRRTPRPAASTAAAAAQQQQQSRGLASLLPSAAAVATPCWRAPSTAAAAAAAAGRRGYAQMGTRMSNKAGYTPPVEMQKAMQMRLSMVSSNLLAEPYRGVPPRLPISAYFTLSGWKEVGRRFMSQFKSLYTLAKCKKAIPGFERKAFKSEALALYKEVCGLLTAGEKSALRHLVTPAVFSDMKRQLKQREDGGWARVHWELTQEPTADQVMTVHGRLIMIDPKDDSTGFAQLTVHIPSKQRFAAFNRAGQLVGGSLDKEIEVEDYWVFEHALKPSAANRWRLAGRLSILPHAAEQRQGGEQQQQQPAVAAAAAAEEPQQMRVGHVAEQQQQSAIPKWEAKPVAPRRQAAAVGRRRR